MKGFEPSTFAMARRRSSQLSYIRGCPPFYPLSGAARIRRGAVRAAALHAERGAVAILYGSPRASLGAGARSSSVSGRRARTW
jgi:hypothetical protein